MEQKFSEFGESDKTLKHELSAYKDPVSHMSLAGAVVVSWSLTQEVAGSNPYIITGILVTEFSKFNDNISGNLKCPHWFGSSVQLTY